MDNCVRNHLKFQFFHILESFTWNANHYAACEVNSSIATGKCLHRIIAGCKERKLEQCLRHMSYVQHFLNLACPLHYFMATDDRLNMVADEN